MNHFPMWLRRPLLCLAASLLAGSTLAGCMTIPGLSALTRKYPIADARHPVGDVVCIWQPGEGHSPQGLPCRGFTGQLMFVSAGSPVPAKVKGKVTIYVFDDVGGLDEQAQPAEVYEFDSQQWACFARETKLGMTYQLFIPYTRKGMKQAECALRVLFNPDEGGSPIYSHMSSVMLKGKGALSSELTALSMRGPTEDDRYDLSEDAAARAFAQKLHDDSQRQRSDQAQVASSLPLAALQTISPQDRLQRLQALLEASEGGVQQASYDVRGAER